MLKLIRKKYRKPCFTSEFTITKPMQLKQDERNYLQNVFSTDDVQTYYRCKYERIQYSSYNWKQSKFDTAILFYKININNLKFRIIDKFIVFNEAQQQLFIQVFELQHEYCDCLTINGVTVKNLNTAIGRVNFTATTQILPTQIVENVICLRRKEQFMFIRLPNKSESS